MNFPFLRTSQGTCVFMRVQIYNRFFGIGKSFPTFFISFFCILFFGLISNALYTLVCSEMLIFDGIGMISRLWNGWDCSLDSVG